MIKWPLGLRTFPPLNIKLSSTDAQTQTDWQIPADLNRKIGEISTESSLFEKIQALNRKIINYLEDQSRRNCFFKLISEIRCTDTDSKRIEKSIPSIIEIYRSQDKIKTLVTESRGELALIMQEAGPMDLNPAQVQQSQKRCLGYMEEAERFRDDFESQMIKFGVENAWFRDARKAADAIYTGYDKEIEARVEKLQQEVVAILKEIWQLELASQREPQDPSSLISRVNAMQKEASLIAPPLLKGEVEKVFTYAQEVAQKMGRANNPLSITNQAEEVEAPETNLAVSVIKPESSELLKSLRSLQQIMKETPMSQDELYDLFIEKVIGGEIVLDETTLCVHLFDHQREVQAMRFIITLGSRERFAICKERILGRKFDHALTIADLMDNCSIEQAATVLMSIQEYDQSVAMLCKLSGSGCFSKKFVLTACRKLMAIKKTDLAIKLAQEVLDDSDKLEFCRILVRAKASLHDVADVASYMADSSTYKNEVVGYMEKMDTEESKEALEYMNLSSRVRRL